MKNIEDLKYIIANKYMFGESMYNTAYNILYNPDTPEDRIKTYNDLTFETKKFFVEALDGGLHSCDIMPRETHIEYEKRVNYRYQKIIERLAERMYRNFHRELQEREERNNGKQRIEIRNLDY